MNPAVLTARPCPPAEWNALIRDLPNAHVLQTAEWGAFKQRATGWQPEHFLYYEQAAPSAEAGSLVGAVMLLTRRLGPLAVMYAPKGPMCDYARHDVFLAILAHLEGLARQRTAIQLKIDPDVVAGWGVPGLLGAAEPALAPKENGEGRLLQDQIAQRGWRFSEEQVQFRNTILIDLAESEEELLARMGQGKRRKVRYGPKHGVTVRAGTLDDLPMLYRLYAETGERNEFITRPYDYYVDEWGTMLRAGLGHILVAEVGGQAVAHVILLHFGRKCLYFTGASTSDNELRKLMPADLLQWEAIRWAKAQGYMVYDLWGAPDAFNEQDRLWGVFQFKRDFGGVVTRHIGAWDFVPYPPLHWLYQQVLPRLLSLIKRLRR
jgi:lipid II:glycine glycyltransferase (peptidoglycan interpeptide bridge formation enzyme)